MGGRDGFEPEKLKNRGGESEELSEVMGGDQKGLS